MNGKAALRSFDRLRMQGEGIGVSFLEDIFFQATVLRKIL
jgi:hypothetical protein